MKRILSSHRINDFLLRYNSCGDCVFLIILKSGYADPRQTGFLSLKRTEFSNSSIQSGAFILISRPRLFTLRISIGQK